MAETRPRAGLLAREERASRGVVVGDGGAGVSGRNKVAGVIGEEIRLSISTYSAWNMGDRKEMANDQKEQACDDITAVGGKKV